MVKVLGSGGTARLWGKIKDLLENLRYASSSSVGGAADMAVGIPFGRVDSTSTSTAFTATVDGITALRDGVCLYLMNGVVTSASGFTVDINNLGAKPVYQTLAAATRASTLFNINYTLLLVYNTRRVEGGCWDAYYGYNSDTNTIGYNVTEYYSGSKKLKTAMQRYQIVLTTMDGLLLPIYSGSQTTSTTKTLTTEKFNPHGQIYYYGTTAALGAGSSPAAGTLLLQAAYTLVDFRYSFNLGSTLTAGNDVYLVCVPQGDGSAKLHSTPIAFSLPQTEDGLLYKRLGKVYDTYRIALELDKPVYHYTGGAIRLWGSAPGASDAAVVHKTGNQAETVTGAKTFDNMNAVKAGASTTEAISADKDSIAASPFSDLWHDVFAFLYSGNSFALSDHQTTVNGTTWTNDTATDLTSLFAGKEGGMITILGDGIKARRFTLYNGSGFFATAQISWYEFALGWTNPFSPFTMKVETSSDKSSWTEICSGTASAVPQAYYIRGNEDTSVMKDYIRITLTKTSGTTGSATMSCIRGLTKRKGDQGRGKEYEFPYDWDKTPSLLPKTAGTSNLGSSGSRWGTVYANTFNGNATSASFAEEAESAETAEQATKDGEGNVISSTYAKKGDAVEKVSGANGTTDAARHVWFSDSGEETKRCYDDDLKYNPSTNEMTVLASSSKSRSGVLTCSTAAGTAGKTVALAGFVLARGAMLTIKFTAKNSAANPTLNVNGTGAKPLYVAGVRSSSAPAASTEYLAIYDGDNWRLETSRVAFAREIPAGADEIDYGDQACEENVITCQETVETALTKIDKYLGAVKASKTVMDNDSGLLEENYIYEGDSLEECLINIDDALADKPDKVASSTDNAIVRFDGTKGAHQNSSAKVDDNGNVILGDVIVHGSVASNDTRKVTSDAADNLYVSVGGKAALVVKPSVVRRGTSAGDIDLGESSYPWNNVHGKKFVTKNGTSSQFVKGDGSLDSNSYVSASALSGKADDSAVVHKTGNLTETVTGVKKFDSMNAVKAIMSRTTAMSPSTDSIATSPFSDSWHDVFAFLHLATSSFVLSEHQTTVDGTAWTNDTSTDLTPLFAAKEGTVMTILPAGILARRFTMYNGSGFFANAMISWYEFSVGWTSPFATFTFKVETSSDKSAWTTICEAEILQNAMPFYIRGNEDTSVMKNYIRITLTKTSGTTGSATMSCIRGLTKRKGDQGRGKEYEFPYSWDKSANLLPKVGGTSNLGGTGAKWNNVYGRKFITEGGSSSQVVLGDGSLASLSSIGGGGGSNFFKGTCATAAGTTAKVVTCPDFAESDLVKGALIFVTFDATNSGAVGSLTMNVNGTGAKAMKKLYNTSGPTNLTNAGEIRANQTYLFAYDGTNWVCLTLDYNNSYSAMSESEYNTGTATTSRTITAKLLHSIIPQDADAIMFNGNTQGFDGNFILPGTSVDECLTELDKSLLYCINEIEPVDVSSMFASTQTIPTGYTLSKLRKRILYCEVSGCRYPVTLTPAYIFYVTYNGSSLSAVSKPADAGGYVTVSGTLKDTNGNVLKNKTITFTPVDTQIGGAAVSATTSSSGTFSVSLHTGTDYRITSSAGTTNPNYLNAYFSAGSKTLNIIV